jgi:hypothetical protein
MMTFYGWALFALAFMAFGCFLVWMQVRLDRLGE